MKPEAPEPGSERAKRGDGNGRPSAGNGSGFAAGATEAPPAADDRPLWRRISDDFTDRYDAAGLGRALVQEGIGLARHPLAALSALTKFAAGSIVAAGATASRFAGAKSEGAMAPPSKDRRFADKAWEENAVYFGLLQQHLLREKLAQDLVDAAGLEPKTAMKAKLASQLAVDATAPSNFLLTNPYALKRAIETGGLSLAKGLRNFLDDVRLREGWPRQFEGSGFQVGKNLAATPGKVVHRNHLMELIQYAPQTPTTFSVPLLCSPMWINKYYIMDLAPNRSFIEWAVKHGHTVFTISYRNPDSTMGDISMDDYLLHGPVEAARVVREITGAPKINVAALCLGGTLATIFLAWLAENGQDIINSFTLTNTLVDFSEPGILGCFTDEETRATVGRLMAKRGYLDSQEMSRTFNMIRANDLIFSYVGSSWLAGEDPPAFDLLAWNSDGTRMPAMMHTSYLRTCYGENQLARGEMMVAGKRLDLKKVKADGYILAAIDDHIAPWRTQYKTTQLVGGKTRFVLSSSGHIAGIVNPPSKSAVHWTNERIGSDPDLWLAGATKKQETWWEDWARWLEKRGGERVAPPKMGSEGYPALGEAPGTYVLGK